MLCINSYSQEYIDQCRAKVDAQVSAYQEIVAVSDDLKGASRKRLDDAVDEFDPLFYNSMVLMLDTYFVHRSRTLELKDGNPLNEVRVLCNSIVSNNGKYASEKSIKLNPAKSLLSYDDGDEIKLTEQDFLLLSKEFFAELETKFLESA
ncbi:MAG TPA: hypothetical protein VMT88_02470 [Actinomycetes bacterium]|nr:hypothetical protein [Actinomycetes bacterium]